jgi:hypothetical protein
MDAVKKLAGPPNKSHKHPGLHDADLS